MAVWLAATFEDNWCGEEVALPLMADLKTEGAGLEVAEVERICWCLSLRRRGLQWCLFPCPYTTEPPKSMGWLLIFHPSGTSSAH